jgi:hypothetical protein
METQQFKIEYRLLLKDGSYMETTTYVAAKDKETALTKLVLWRKTQSPEFDDIGYFNVEQGYNIVV